MIAEPLAMAAGVLTTSASLACLVARSWQAGPPSLPRDQRVPSTVAAETVIPADEPAPCVGFYGQPATIRSTPPETVWLDHGWCPECDAERYGRVHPSGAYTCGGCGHRTGVPDA